MPIRIFVLVCVFLGGLGQGVVNPKLPELLADHARLALDSGVSASLMYLGIFGASFLYGRAADRGYVFRLLAFGLVLYSSVLLLFVVAGSGEAVFALRFCEGLAVSAIYVAADVVLCRASRDDERGRWLSYYGVALSLGLLAGPLTVMLVEHVRGGSALGATLAGLAGVPLLFGGLSLGFRLPAGAPDERGTVRRRAVPAAVLYGFLEAGLVAVLAALVVERFRVAVEPVFIALILAAVPASLVWGWLIDRVGGRRALLAVFLVFVASEGALGILSASLPPAACAYLTAAAFGVAAGGIYPAGFAWLVEGCPPSRFGYASGLFTRAYGLGSLFGPLCFGFAVEGAGERGFFALAFALGLVGIACASRVSSGTGAS